MTVRTRLAGTVAFLNFGTGNEGIQLVVARNVGKPAGNQSEAVWPRFRGWLDAVNLAAVSNRRNIRVCLILPHMPVSTKLAWLRSPGTMVRWFRQG